MKKLSLLLLVITATASSYAIPAKGTTVKKIETDEIVTSLKVYNNVEVVLTNDGTHEISIVGEKADVDKTTVKIVKGELIITNSTGDYLNEKVTVYVPAKALAIVSIHGASTVSSTEVLANELIDVTINGEGRSEIKTAGSVSVNTIGDFPMEACPE